MANDRTNQMFDSIQGSLEGAPRIPISERLRPLGATPVTPTMGAAFHRHGAASFVISTTNMEPADWRSLVGNSEPNSPSSTSPSSAARKAAATIFDASPGA